jgi:hypothetical protein
MVYPKYSWPGGVVVWNNHFIYYYCYFPPPICTFALKNNNI